MYTYGPVPSRRLGRSLGVSIIPHKTCTYSCVYCQLGRTRHPQIQPRSFFPREEILAEIEDRCEATEPDYVTFVGDGEPALSSDLGRLIEQCKARWSIPVAVITNGSLLYRPDTREAMTQADVVLPSLDAGDPDTFHAINRPHEGLDFRTVVEGMVEFRKTFTGKMRLEVMLVKDLNSSKYQLRQIRKLAWAIRPERIDVAIPIRPPAERWVSVPDPDEVLQAQRLLRSAETMIRPEHGEFDYAGFGTVREALTALAQRHPLRWDQAEEIEQAFGEHGRLQEIVDQGTLAVRDYGKTRFLVPVNCQDSA